MVERPDWSGAGTSPSLQTTGTALVPTQDEATTAIMNDARRAATGRPTRSSGTTA